MLNLGIFAKTYNHLETVESIFNAISKHGINGVHYNMICSGLSELPTEVSTEIIHQVRLNLEKHHLSLVGLSATFNMIDVNLEKRAEGFIALEAIAKAAKAIGTDFVSLCTGTRHSDKWTWHPDNNSKAAWKELLISMEKAIEIAEVYGITLGIEPETGNIVNKAVAAKKLIDEMRSPRLRVILDPANLFEHANSQQQIRDLISESLDLLHDRIEVAHAKDRSLEGLIKPAGKGAVDFQYFTDLLKKSEFTGPLIMHGLAYQDVEAASNHLNKFL